MLTITGPTSALLNNFQLQVGEQGAGLLEISGGAAASNGTASIGAGSGAFGDAVVTGEGTVWDCDGTLTVGKGGFGSLLISDGAEVVTAADAIIALQLPSFGDVTVTGPGSSWTVLGSLDVGLAGLGTLTIADGATVTNEIFAALGGFPEPGTTEGAVGEVIVGGPGSVWTVNGDLYVGFVGFGRWTLSSGGQVAVDGDLVGGSWLPSSETPQTIIELSDSDDYQTPAISVTGMADGFSPRVDLVDGFVPQPGDTFLIATAGISLGTFGFDLPDLPSPLAWEVIQDANTIELRVGPLLADLNDDFVVNVLDLITMLLAFGDCPDPPEGCPADVNEDGAVDRLDLIILLDEFG
jgi:T5SS/PEP-CTERM-associated repeat protein